MNKSDRTAATLITVLASMMVLIDSTIANVALPEMKGTLGATSTQITWVLTSFTMAEAIFIPLAGYFTLRLGERNLMIYSIIGFVITSALCGQADSLMEIVFFRILQGMFAASVIPLSQSILVQIYPKEERGKAMAIFGIGVMLGPILGPMLGGIITQHLNWRWVFYVNLPVGCGCLLLIMRYIHVSNRGTATIDWPTALSMALGIGLLQMVLSKGNEKNWFDSNLILFSTVLCILMLVVFAVRSVTTKSQVAPIWLLGDKNLATACLIVSCFAMCTFGVLQLQPMLLQELLGYPVETSGFVTAPRGLASAVLLICAAPLMDKIDGRILVFIGLTLNATGVWFMTQYSLEADIYWMIFPAMIQGAGMGMVFAPLSNIAFTTLPASQVTNGASLFNLSRTIGASIGIALTNTFFSQVKQEEWHSLGGAISPDNPILQQIASQQGVPVTDPVFLRQVAGNIEQQSSMLAFVLTFWLMLFIYISLIFLLPLFRQHAPKQESETPCK